MGHVSSFATTHATLARQANIDPKLVADQLGHGLGVHLDVYSVSGLAQRQQVVQTLEAIVRPEAAGPNVHYGICRQVERRQPNDSLP
jgi:hypothetical protein